MLVNTLRLVPFHVHEKFVYYADPTSTMSPRLIVCHLPGSSSFHVTMYPDIDAELPMEPMQVARTSLCVCVLSPVGAPSHFDAVIVC